MALLKVCPGCGAMLNAADTRCSCGQSFGGPAAGQLPGGAPKTPPGQAPVPRGAMRENDVGFDLPQIVHHLSWASTWKAVGWSWAFSGVAALFWQLAQPAPQMPWVAVSFADLVAGCLVLWLAYSHDAKAAQLARTSPRENA